MRKQYKEKYIDLEFLLSIYEVDGRVNTSEYTGVCTKTKTSFICSGCGKPITIIAITLKNNNFVLQCKSCRTKETCMEKYGVSNPSQSTIVKDKKKDTFMSHYGVDNYSKSKEHDDNIANIIAKSKETCLRRYNVENYSQTEEFKEKKKNTFLSRYGVPYYSQSKEFKSRLDEIISKQKKTCMEKYGVDCYSKLPEWRDIIKNIFMERYNVEWYNRTAEYKKKSISTCLSKFNAEYYSQSEDYKRNLNKILDKHKESNIKRFGVPNYSQSDDAHKHRRTHIFYDNQWFDSKPELDYYKACLLANKKIIRHPIRLKYLYNNIVYYYFPDFLVDGRLVEIKGKHFINPETGKWRNPFDPSLNEKYEAKYDCAIMNNVTIIYV